MKIIEFIKTLFDQSDNTRLENFIEQHNPLTEMEVEELTRQYHNTRTMQWFNNC